MARLTDADLREQATDKEADNVSERIEAAPGSVFGRICVAVELL